MDSKAEKILVLATGGSIAQTSPKDPTLLGDTLVDAVPQLRNIADISVEQIAQVSSPDISVEHWLRLARRINEVLAGNDVQGVVVTHGTDTLEETAYFLNLVVSSDKPVVVVGAMRRPYSLGADGSANLYNGVAVARDPNSRGKGVLVTLNAEIHAARDVTKTTFNLDAFKAPDFGPLGYVNAKNGTTHFYRSPTRKHTTTSELSLDCETLPRVAILYSYVGVTPDLFEAVAAAGYKGVVWAGTGNANLPKVIRPAASEAVKSGMAVVRASRVNCRIVSRNDEIDDDAFGFVTADSLSPQKARILLMLALTKTADPARIQEFFDAH
ncbi:asparaginase [Mesorhizobium sp.]|uniref:asparaginase n=1 Tax=Mesorhizobium sp. TaxID=1871066 RepID=UPI0011FAE8ED|nr:asparaginase [Mesorhizobium sp.]TIV59137.1 MAG: asparaginase [Mesorhizobium sp.]